MIGAGAVVAVGVLAYYFARTIPNAQQFQPSAGEADVQPSEIAGEIPISIFPSYDPNANWNMPYYLSYNVPLNRGGDQPMPSLIAGSNVAAMASCGSCGDNDPAAAQPRV